MFLSDFSIKRPTATIVLILAMMCVGLLALKKLRVNQNPDVEVPFIVVSIPYPGASPDTVEREVVNRLEKSLQSISGVTEVNSDSNEGSATIFLKFSFNLKNLVTVVNGLFRFSILPWHILKFAACMRPTPHSLPVEETFTS